jgi:hypothetical protein
MEKTFLPNGMEAYKAEYNEFPLAEFNQNPFIQVLPPLVDKETIIKKLTVNPTYSKEEVQMEAVYRIHMLQRLYQWFQPLPIHIEVWNMMYNLILQGYIARNPFDRDYKMFINGRGKSIINRSFDINSRSNFRTTAGCGTFIGLSGMGKTTSFNRTLSSIPQVVIHSEFMGKPFSQIQLVWLKLDAPANSSLKALCFQFFMKVDNLLGTNNYSKYVSRNFSVDSMLPLIGMVAQNIGLGCLIVDETQNLTKNSNHIMNFFVSLINSGINLALIGTPGSYRIFENELRIARRLTGNAEIIYNNMGFNDEFKFLLESMWKYQWTKFFTPLSEELVRIFYEETQGVSDLIVKLYVSSQQYVIDTGKEKLTVQIVKKVAKDRFRLMRPMLEALKSGNPYKIAKYEDIRRIDHAVINNNGSIDSEKNKTNKAPSSPIKEQVEKKTNIKEEKKIRPSEYMESDLRRLIYLKDRDDPKTPYNLLLESGFIDDMSMWKDGILND